MSPDETKPQAPIPPGTQPLDHPHEPDDMDVRRVAALGVALGGLVIGAVLLIRGLDHSFVKWDPNAMLPARPPTDPQKVASSPPLVPDQSVLLGELREREERILTSYGWVDRKAGVARIPIERAIELAAQPNGPLKLRSSQSPAKSKAEPKGKPK